MNTGDARNIDAIAIWACALVLHDDCGVRAAQHRDDTYR
jgi:hypothetical protein